MRGKHCVFHRVHCAVFLVAVDIEPLALHQGWGESVVPGLRGTAWKQKVASIECLGQGATSGENRPHLETLKYAHADPTGGGGMVHVEPIGVWADLPVVMA